MNKIHTAGEVVEGKLTLKNEGEFKRMLRYLKGEVEVIVQKPKNKRDAKFNAYYWGACGYVAKKLAAKGCEGWTNEDVHQYSKENCNPVVRIMVDGNGEMREHKLPGGTREMTTSEFGEYVERFKQFWAEQDIYIPDEYWK